MHANARHARDARELGLPAPLPWPTRAEAVEARLGTPMLALPPPGADAPATVAADQETEELLEELKVMDELNESLGDVDLETCVGVLIRYNRTR